MEVIHRDFDLKHELLYVVLRLVQMRDIYLESHTGWSIVSVKYRNKELQTLPELRNTDLSAISVSDALNLCNRIGYRKQRNAYGKIVSKIDITVNGKNYSVRCLNFIDRPLINHSHRRKYEEVCKRINLPIEKLDKMIDDYWICRNWGIFNEDCHPYSSMNPFVDHHDYLKELLSYMVFHSFDYDYPYNDDRFIAETVDNILDYVVPWDESTWSLYNAETYFDTVWPYLRFSLRDNKGMPTDEELDMPENRDLWRWICVKNDRKKGALHVRIERFNAEEHARDFSKQFEVIHDRELQEVSVNQGELDEYLIKLFLVDCRQKKLPVPIGEENQIVKSVGSKDEEYGTPRSWLDWNSQSPKMIVYVCNQIKAAKSPSGHKSDVYVNGVGISVKSRRGGAVTLINQTSREKIMRVMQSVNSPILPLDRIVDRYWNLRLNGNCGEDVSNTSMPYNPFCRMEDGSSNEQYLTPLLEYFAFKGSGTEDSPAPADFVLSIGLPDDTSTWVYYSKENFAHAIWDYLIFSIRGKGLPKKRTPEMLPWIRKVNGNDKGTLNVRIKHLPE